MKNSLLKLTQAAFCLIIILSPTGPTSGQTDCSLRSGGAGSDAAAWRFDWCDETPGDVTGTQSGITCRACLAENGVHQGYWAKGGNSNCTAFSKQQMGQPDTRSLYASYAYYLELNSLTLLREFS